MDGRPVRGREPALIGDHGSGFLGRSPDATGGVIRQPVLYQGQEAPMANKEQKKRAAKTNKPKLTTKEKQDRKAEKKVPIKPA